MIRLYTGDVGDDRARRIVHLVAAYPYLLRHHIRSGCLCEKSKDEIKEKEYRLKLHEPTIVKVETRHEGDENCGGTTKAETVVGQKSCWVDRRKLPWSLFEQAELKKVARSHNRPLWVCDRVGDEIVSIPYSPNYTSRERLAFLGMVDKLTNAIGQCERIHQTAVPLNYARHSLRSLTIWLFTLPFALVKDLGLLTPVVSALSAWILFGVYQIGYSIEDPFQGSLRLSILCDSIRRDVLGVMKSDYGDDLYSENNRNSAYPLAMKQAMHESVPSGLFGHSEPATVNDHQVEILSNPPEFFLEKNGSWGVLDRSH